MISNEAIDRAVKDDPYFWAKTLQRFYKTEDGKLALLWHINNAGFGDSFPDPVLEAQNAGRRSFVSELLALLKVDLSTVIVNDESTDLLDRILED
jgi:hypothetical protein